MSTPVRIQAAIYCGGKHDFPVSLIVPLGNKKRGQYEGYATGYAEGKGWTVSKPDAQELFARTIYSFATSAGTRTLGASDNDWRCPVCSKAATA